VKPCNEVVSCFFNINTSFFLSSSLALLIKAYVLRLGFYPAQLDMNVQNNILSFWVKYGREVSAFAVSIHYYYYYYYFIFYFSCKIVKFVKFNFVIQGRLLE
jgi:hypothetical protein